MNTSDVKFIIIAIGLTQLIKGIPQTTFIITTPDFWQDYEEDLRLLLSPFVKKDHHFIAKTMPKILPIRFTIKEHKTLTSVIISLSTIR